MPVRGQTGYVVSARKNVNKKLNGSAPVKARPPVARRSLLPGADKREKIV